MFFFAAIMLFTILGTLIYNFITFFCPEILPADWIEYPVDGSFGVSLLLLPTVFICIGLVKVIIAFTRAVIATARRRKELKDEIAKKSDGSVFFEDIALKSYLFGPCFKDIGSIMKNAFSNLFKNMPDFSLGDDWFTHLCNIIRCIIDVLIRVLVGIPWTLVFSAVMCVIFLMIEIPLLIITGIALIIENIFFAAKKISYRCPDCKSAYKLPIYICPKCGVKHRRLRPGVYGIIRRRCSCGEAKLPLTAKGRGYYRVWGEKSKIYHGVTVITSVRVKKKVRFSELAGKCPSCGRGSNSGLTKPMSIALIGGAASGKTTFKVAFAYDFLKEETVKAGFKFDFPDAGSKLEYENSLRCYLGTDIIAGTNRGTIADISTFSFSLESKKLGTPRMIQIYDMPGEVFESGDAKEGLEHYSFSEGLVFLIDPFSFPNIKNMTEGEVKSSSMSVCGKDMNALIEALIDVLRNIKVEKKRNNGKFTLPVALTINKVDTPLLDKMCGDEAINALMNGAPMVFTDYFTAMDYTCRCFLVKNGGTGFIANLDNNFDTVHFFFSSPMGYIPKAERTRFAPKNVLPIMQWMMLRADTELNKAWSPERAVVDLTDEQKQLYLSSSEFYDKYVVPLYQTVGILGEGADDK